jgi:hypothetical protein
MVSDCRALSGAHGSSSWESPTLLPYRVRCKDGQTLIFRWMEYPAQVGHAHLWLSRRIVACLGDEEVGRLDLEYLPGERQRRHVPDPLAYAYEILGWGGFSNDPADRLLLMSKHVLPGDEWPAANRLRQMGLPEITVALAELESQVAAILAQPFRDFVQYHVDAPTVAWIDVDAGIRRRRIATGLYEVAARVVGERGLRLWESGTQAPESEAVWAHLTANPPNGLLAGREACAGFLRWYLDAIQA